MVGHCRAPGVQDGQDTDAGAEVLGIGRDRQHCLRRGFKQQVVDCGLVLIGDIGNLAWQAEHHVKVRHRQQLCLAFGQPLLCRRPLALRAMPVAAGVIGDDGVSAVLATLDMAAECCRAAMLNRRHHLQLVEADVSGVSRTPCRTVVAEDIRDLQLWTQHCRGRLRLRLHLAAALLSFPGSLVLWSRQPVERALDGGDHAGGDVEIARSCFQFLVTE